MKALKTDIWYLIPLVATSATVAVAAADVGLVLDVAVGVVLVVEL